jgi:uncharacterized membrane-anchored protein
MTRAAWRIVGQAAQALGLTVQPGPAPQAGTPWALQLMMGLGAWLVALPTFALGVLLFEEVLHGWGGLLLGGAGTVLALVLLRARPRLFTEQLFSAVLLACLLLVGFELWFELDWGLSASAWTLSAWCLGLAWLLPPGWLVRVMGACAAALSAGGMSADVGAHWLGSETTALWAVWHVQVVVASVALRMADGWCTQSWRATSLQRLDDVAQGGMAVALVGLALMSGMTFLAAGLVVVGEAWDASQAAQSLVRQTGSAAIVVLWVGGMVWRWPVARQAWLLGVAAVLAVLAWYLPTLGGVSLALAVLIVLKRGVLAAAAALAGAWVLGTFYYDLSWSLASKASVLLALALVLAALAAWGGARLRSASTRPAEPPANRPARWHWPWGAAVAAGLVVLVANVGIWQKEQLIRQGQVVFVPLVPVDPRSLMQGDYMRLNFVGWRESLALLGRAKADGRAHVTLTLDARGVASNPRFGYGQSQPLAAGDLRLPLTHKAGRWVLVTDAFYFKEGEGDRWRDARFGEFRVDADGRALLVGLRGAELQAL